MRRKAFTLVELLVVIGIIALLLAILVPQLSSARSLARAVACQHNLTQINAAFPVAAREIRKGVQPPLYPDRQKWPLTPYEVLPDIRVFRCPEDPGGQVASFIPGLVYHLSAASYGDIRVPFQDSLSCLSRRGSDAKGAYVEFVFEESPGVQVQWCPSGPNEYPNCNHHDDKDGVFRFYTNPDGTVTMKLMNFHDNRLTIITRFGEKFWPKNPGETLHNYVGRSEVLSVPTTSYGLNSNVEKQYTVAPDTIILLDYDEHYVDMQFPNVVVEHLGRSQVARHLGRVNVLSADSSVRRMGTAAINPTINPKIWDPRP